MTDLSHTIAAEATPPGRGALRVVRLSGPRSVGILKEIFLAKGPLPWDRPRTLCLGDVGESGRAPLDRALAVCFPAPDSFTGEDVVEIQAHGAPGVVRGLMDLASRRGARLALPGEFSYRAFLNGKLSIMEAEAIDALVGAETDGQASDFGSGLRGGLEGELRQILEAVLDVRAEWEAHMDFPEEMETSGVDGTRKTLSEVGARLYALLAGSASLRYLREGWRVALVGPVNSGKSSLFNALLQRERALVTPHPGTTRDVLEESLQIGGYPLVLMDTAGVRESGDPVESLGVARGLEAAAHADGALLVYDGQKGWGPEEAAILAQLPHPPLALLANKADVGPASGESPAGSLAVSALTGQGLATLSGILRSWMEGVLPGDRHILATERQIGAVRRAAEGCREARAALDAGEGEDLASEGLMAAQKALEECLDGGAPDDIYERIFARFCIGK